MMPGNMSEMYAQQQQQQQQQMVPPQFLSMPQLMQSIDPPPIDMVPSPPQQQQQPKAKKRSAKANSGNGKRAKTSDKQSPASKVDDESGESVVAQPPSTTTAKKPTKKSTKKPKQQPAKIDSTNLVECAVANEYTNNRIAKTVVPTTVMPEATAVYNDVMDDDSTTRSFHDFAQMVHMLKLFTPSERDNALSSLLQTTMTPAERNLCMNSLRPANKRRVRDVYQALCYGLNNNADRAKHMLTDTVQQRGLYSLLSTWNPTEKVMLRFREHWYPFTGPMLCEWTAYTAECIERSLNTTTPLKGVGCHVCIDAYIQLCQTGSLFGPIPTEEELQRKRLQPKKSPPTANGDKKKTDTEQPTEQPTEQQQPQQQYNKPAVGGGKNIANLQQQHNATELDNTFPEDSNDNMDVDSGSEADYDHRATAAAPSTLFASKAASTYCDNNNEDDEDYGSSVDDDDEDDAAGSDYQSDDCGNNDAGSSRRAGNPVYDEAAKN